MQSTISVQSFLFSLYLFYLLQETMLKEVEEALENWDGKKSKTWCSRVEALNTAWEDHIWCQNELNIIHLSSFVFLFEAKPT